MAYEFQIICDQFITRHMVEAEKALFFRVRLVQLKNNCGT
jgi:hypothetical protein